MEFLDIVEKVIEYANKGEEVSDEIKSINVTVHTIKESIQKIK